MPHSQDTRHMRYETLYIMLLIFASGLFLAGALLDTPDNIARGLIRIVMTEDPLITDYVRLAGVGAAPDQLLCSHRPLGADPAQLWGNRPTASRWWW